MNSELVERIARAVLYEGYCLYPYRPSALKNRQRWNFGVLYPETWAAAQKGSDRSYFQMECLAVGGAHLQLDVTLRFLHVMERSAGAQSWQEAIERSVPIRDLSVEAIVSSLHKEALSFPAAAPGEYYRQKPLQAEVEIQAVPVQEGAFRINVSVRNTTTLENLTRDDALLRSLASAHAVLAIRDGEFVSQTDPPDSLCEAAAACGNVGVWPVLVGEEGAHDTMLGSPIILSDYPQIAPESSGDLFDGTEIDEILSLRILTMTEAEKAEIRQSDERAKEILDRLEANPAEHLMQLHGAIRGMRSQSGIDLWNPWPEAPKVTSARIAGVDVKKGDRVRLRPGKRADIFDSLLDGKTAVIEAIEQDYEDKVHIAVVIEDDPGRDLGEMRQAGHRFFFSGSEVEPIPAENSDGEPGL